MRNVILNHLDEKIFSWNKIKRVTFVLNLKKRTFNIDETLKHGESQKPLLMVNLFATEVKALARINDCLTNEMKHISAICNSDSFFYKDCIICVGGRLQKYHLNETIFKTSYFVS